LGNSGPDSGNSGMGNGYRVFCPGLAVVMMRGVPMEEEVLEAWMRPRRRHHCRLCVNNIREERERNETIGDKEGTGVGVHGGGAWADVRFGDTLG
jgi:hypothetical protein